MTFDPDKHHRRSIRFEGYDYAQPGTYFLTVCTYQRESLLGRIESGQVVLSDAGETARLVWDGLPSRFPSVGLDEYVIMPNHVHGIVLVGAQFIAPDPKGGLTDHLLALGEIVRAYKATVTRLVRRRDDGATNPDVVDKGVMNHAPTGFGWQRGYYEHVVRNEAELTAIREYIQNNPGRWDEDENNPAMLDSGGRATQDGGWGS
jgi:putative transposase